MTACSSTPRTDFSVATNYQPHRSAYDLGINFTRKHYYTVPQNARIEYNNCLEFALRNMQVGEECKWQTLTPRGVDATGIVKLVQIDATGCHYLFNSMWYRGKEKLWQVTACYNGSTKRWKTIE